MLSLIKKSLRVSTSEYDDEITALIAECKKDLQISGVYFVNEDELIKRAIRVYCSAHFGEPTNQSELLEIYNKVKADLMMNIEYKVDYEN